MNRKLTIRLLVLGCFITFGLNPAAKAAYRYFDDGDPYNHYWSTSGNWVSDQVPVSSDTVYIGDTVHGNSNKMAVYASSNTNMIQNLFIQNSCILRHSQSSISYPLKPSALYVGGSAGVGTYQLYGGKIEVLNDSQIGWQSDGLFTQNQSVSNTVHKTKYLKLGTLSGKTGTYNLYAGTVDVLMVFYCGNQGTGRFNQTGGTCNVSDDLIIGNNSGSDGKYSLNGGSCIVTDDVKIGVANGTTGEFEITSGVLNVTGSVLIGTASGASGSATLDVRGSSMALYVGETFHLGTRAHLEVSEGVTAKITMVGSASMFHIDEGVGPDNLALNQLKLTFKTKDNSNRKKLEVAGVDAGLPDAGDFDSDNFVLKELVVGKDNATGPITLQLVDDEDNQDDGEDDEALYVDTLTIKAGGTFAKANGQSWSVGQPDYDLYYKNTGNPKKFWMGDLDLDGNVDWDDFTTLRGNYGAASGMCWQDGDLDGDGDIDWDDYTLLRSNYGQGGGDGGDGLPTEDVDGDGDFDGDDLRIIIERWRAEQEDEEG